MNNKANWRMTEEEFNLKVDKLIDDTVKRLQDKVDSSDKNYIDLKFRLSKYYKCKPEEKLEFGKKIVLADMDRWIDISNSDSKDDIDEIVTRLILTSLEDRSYICFIYFSNAIAELSEDFINDVVYIDSGYFRFKDWDDEHVNAIVDALDHSDKCNKGKYNKPGIRYIDPEYQKKLSDLYQDNSIVFEAIRNRIDWKCLLSSNCFSNEFKEKHSGLLK